MIFLQPHSGLANRIRAIISGINLSVKQSQALTILWSNDDSLSCDFKDIFEQNKIFRIVDVTHLIRLMNFIRENKFFRKGFLYIFKIKNFILDSDIPNLVWSTGSNNIDFDKLSVEKGNTYVYTCHEFYFNRNLLQYLQPTNEIKYLVEKNKSFFSNNTIGIHIRRADHVESILNSPIELFVEAISSELVNNSDTSFFLSTDDIETELFLIEKFGGKIITSKKEFSRTTTIGIKGAMVDLYTLAATQKIIGSFYSSFSDIASRIGDIPLEIIKK